MARPIDIENPLTIEQLREQVEKMKKEPVEGGYDEDLSKYDLNKCLCGDCRGCDREFTASCGDLIDELKEAGTAWNKGGMNVEKQRDKLIELIVNAKRGVFVPDDGYDLDHLRELVEADKDGRCKEVRI